MNFIIFKEKSYEKRNYFYMWSTKRVWLPRKKYTLKKLSKETYYFIPSHYGDHLPVLVREQGVSSVGSSFNLETSPNI